MFCPLTYLFGHSIYFARLHHVNPLCKHKCAFLQMKEALNQKVQEKKPLLKLKNTKKYMCLERIWRKSFRQRPLMHIAHAAPSLCKQHFCNSSKLSKYFLLRQVWQAWKVKTFDFPNYANLRWHRMTEEERNNKISSKDLISL